MNKVLWIDAFDVAFDGNEMEDFVNKWIKDQPRTTNGVIKDIKVVNLDEGVDTEGNRICMKGLLFIFEE